MRNSLEAAAICTPGLETALIAELTDMGLHPKQEGPGAVRFRPSLRQLYSANVWLRSASRVLLRLGTFRATDFPHLEERAAEIDWKAYLADGVAPMFRVSSTKSALYHTEAITERLHRIVGKAPVGDQPSQSFVVRFYNDVATVSVDSSGTALNHRPWREAIGVAPMRPPMAAAMLGLAGWDGSTSLADPFCGSGTIPIEAALLARGMPPGGKRRFAFGDWDGFEPGTWASVNGGIASSQVDLGDITIEASDRDKGASEIARNNAEAAGVADSIIWSNQAVSHLEAHEGSGMVVTNPPYGIRIGKGDLSNLYAKFGDTLAKQRPGWGLTMLTADVKLASQASPNLEELASFGHGGTRVHVVHRGPTTVST